jgi:DNA-binding XRE family transcriptional regulator
MIANTVNETMNGVVNSMSQVATKTSPAELLAASKRKAASGKGKKEKRHRIKGRVECRLRTVRKKLGLTMTEVSAATGVPYLSIYQWEVGWAEPLVTSAVKIASFYGCSVSDLWPTDNAG